MFDHWSLNEWSVLALTWFDVLVTVTLDAFEEQIISHEAGVLLASCSNFCEGRQESLSIPHKVRKGGMFPQQISKRLKELLFGTTSNFFFFCHQLLLRQLKSLYDSILTADVDVAAMFQRTKELRTDKSSRKYTICFNYCNHRH